MTADDEDKENQADVVARPNKRRCVPEDEVDSDKYTEYIEKLRNEHEKEEPRRKTVRSLMKKTFSGRQQWIQQDCPTVEEILGTFPSIQKPKMVSVAAVN